MLLQRLNPLAFVLSLGVGMLVVYMLAKPPKIVIEFPTPASAGNVVYRDGQKGCYVYVSEAARCDDTALPQPADPDPPAAP